MQSALILFIYLFLQFPSTPYLGCSGLCINTRLFSKIIRQGQIKQGAWKLALTQSSALQVSVKKPLVLFSFSCVH